MVPVDGGPAGRVSSLQGGDSHVSYFTPRFFLGDFQWRDLGRRVLALPPDVFAFEEKRSYLIAATCEFLGFLDTSWLTAEGKRNVRRTVRALAARYPEENPDAVDAEFGSWSREHNPS